MGSKEENDEKLPHRVDIPYPYFIGRYPITHAQYDAFVQAGGYRERRYWPEAEKAGVWQPEGVRGWLDQEPRRAPYDFGRPFNLPNHPVVGLTWFEMLALSRWLSDAWQEAGLLPQKWRVQLPSEAEWEKAARGGLQLPAQPVVIAVREVAGWLEEGLSGDVDLVENPRPQQRYPWGDEPDSHRANDKDSEIGSTSCVGAFPRGTSPYGCEEMSGNVWEWTRSHYGKYPYQPEDGREQIEKVGPFTSMTLRGGSWANDENRLRCSFRLRYDPLLHVRSGAVFGWCWGPHFLPLVVETMDSGPLIAGVSPPLPSKEVATRSVARGNSLYCAGGAGSFSVILLRKRGSMIWRVRKCLSLPEPLIF
jgi:formylglycine-generating enzyme required for sulfatase activity